MEARRGGGAAPLPLPAAASRKAADSEWVPLPDHPVFSNRSSSTRKWRSLPSPHYGSPATQARRRRTGTNLVAWDASSSRLYIWDTDACYLHRLTIRFGDPDDEGTAPVEALSPSEVLLSDTDIGVSIRHISVNNEGSAVLIAGSSAIFVMYVYDRICSEHDSIICRTVSVGSDISFGESNGMQIIQALWHPYSRTHIGILSSESVIRLYDLSLDLKRPEQEFYLQPFESGKCDNVLSICPVAFAFGGEHLWDRFSVFILFSNGSIYVLCPVVPFGSVFSLPCLEELYEDVNVFGLKSSNDKAVSNSWLAMSWLESTFPELSSKSQVNASALRAHPYAPMDASLSLQGPLCKVSHRETSNRSLAYTGSAVGFLYNAIGKDSLLATSWSSGHLEIDALADEVQPLWIAGASPRLQLDSRGHILGVAMICEPISQGLVAQNISLMLDQGMVDTAWLGNAPTLLRLAAVDLALSETALRNSSIYMFHDPVVPERLYCVHYGGVDVITLHFLPFSNPNPGADDSARVPSVYPILGASDSKMGQPLLCGFVAVADSFGHPRVIGITPSYECVMLEMQQWNELPSLPVDLITKSVDSDTDLHEFISKDALAGPKIVLIPDSTALRSVSAESIEGRSALHHYTTLFHENYLQYAYKVYFELKEHRTHLQFLVNQQHNRLHEVRQMLSGTEVTFSSLKGRINRAMQGYMHLEKRLQNLKALPGTKRKPLSKAECEFKAQLERLAGSESDALHSSIEALKARLRRLTQSPDKALGRPKLLKHRRHELPDTHISQLKSALEKLSLINSENTKKVKIIEQSLKEREELD